jgi:hypothetical protein
MTRHAAVLTTALAALTACQAEELVGEVHGVMFGVAASTNTTDEAIQESAFTDVELKTGRSFDLDRIFRQWNNARPGARERWTIEAGRTPVVSFKTSAEAPWSAIANGDHDTELVAMAEAYLALQRPVFCIFDQSPENSAGTLGTPTEYIAAYRHVVEIFRSQGATQVMWIFNLKSPSFSQDPDLYYPGDDVIQWIGTSAYNFAVGPGGRWESFAELILPFVEWGKRRGKPLIVTEWNSREDPSDPDRRAAWIDAAAITVHATPEIRAMSAFWSVADGTGFDSSAATLRAFRDIAADPYMNPRKPATP